jgi:hypothetical protein
MIGHMLDMVSVTETNYPVYYEHRLAFQACQSTACIRAMRDNLYSALDLKLDPRKLVCEASQ